MKVVPLNFVKLVLFLGVSVGAILSNYQKDRVDNVCRRLNMKTLCYLWGRDQLELYDDMIQDGIEAIIIKVAAAGLTTKHLGMTLKEVCINHAQFLLLFWSKTNYFIYRFLGERISN